MAKLLLPSKQFLSEGPFRLVASAFERIGADYLQFSRDQRLCCLLQSCMPACSPPLTIGEEESYDAQTTCRSRDAARLLRYHGICDDSFIPEHQSCGAPARGSDHASASATANPAAGTPQGTDTADAAFGSDHAAASAATDSAACATESTAGSSESAVRAWIGNATAHSGTHSTQASDAQSPLATQDSARVVGLIFPGTDKVPGDVEVIGRGRRRSFCPPRLTMTCDSGHRSSALNSGITAQ